VRQTSGVTSLPVACVAGSRLLRLSGYLAWATTAALCRDHLGYNSGSAGPDLAAFEERRRFAHQLGTDLSFLGWFDKLLSPHFKSFIPHF